MTRLLFWNLENFALEKIECPSAEELEPGSSLTKSQAAGSRKSVIFWLFREVNPDIFILVENRSSYSNSNDRGRLADGPGKEGAISLAKVIRTATGNDDWMLVPPLRTGPGEAVAVYYRSTDRYFTGPNVWPGGGEVKAQRPGDGVNSGDYPNEFNSLLPSPSRNIPEQAQHNAKLNEKHAAARIDFTYKMGHQMFRQPVVFTDGQHVPYMVTFYESSGTPRNIALFAIHGPAKSKVDGQSKTAGPYLQNLANYAEIVGPQRRNEVRVVAGDFNCHLLGVNYEYYLDLQKDPNKYILALSPGIPAPVGHDRYYFATHISNTDVAAYWSTDRSAVYYPGYDYFTNPPFAIDNIFTRHGDNAGRPADNHFTIMNPVVGSPYNRYPAPETNPPKGSISFGIHMRKLVAPRKAGMHYSRGLETLFRSWYEYRHIRSVSDHLALAIDI